MKSSRLKTRAELKQEAKELYRGQWFTAIKLNLVPVFLRIISYVLVVLGLLSFFFLMRDFFSSNGSLTFSFNQNLSNNHGSSASGSLITVLFFDLINLGIMYTTIDWLRTKDAPSHLLSSSFTVFQRKYFWGSLVIQLLTYLFTFFWSLLLVIPGIIKNLAYSQAPYIFKDLTDANLGNKISYLDCISQSRALMKGQKWRLFWLQVSFIGWDILAILSLGIGLIWLRPYKCATYAAFYSDLTTKLTPASESEVY